MSTQASKLKELQQAFITADKDGDRLLNKVEFTQFVQIGYRKPCPDGMYENLCQHFNRDPTIGIDWNTARAVWQQAQKQSSNPGKSPSPQQPTASPSPPKPQNGTIPNATSTIKQAFIQCDKDGDGLLNKAEFHEFVKVGFKKPSVPNGMYEQVCGHFKKDPNQGVDWLSAYTLWKQSNPASLAKKPANTATNNTTSNSKDQQSESGSPRKTKTPPPDNKGRARPPPIKRMQTEIGIPSSKEHHKSALAGLASPGALSPAKSTGNLIDKHNDAYSGSSALTERNLRALDKGTYSRERAEDEVSVESDNQSFRSSNRRLRRAMSNTGRGSFDDGPDASQMVVQMMETKVKNLQNQLKLERTKRKKTEELAQSLLTQNEEYKKQVADLQGANSKFRGESKAIKDQLRKLKQQVDDDRQTIKHLTTQRTTMKTERDEAYEILSKLEKEHAMMVKKEKAKHKAEMEKLSAGFLQSLGAEPGKDVTTVIRELRQSNKSLRGRVETLAATLERKNASLLEALKAVDTIAMEDEKKESTNYQAQSAEAGSASATTANGQHAGNGKMRERLRHSFHERRKSLTTSLRNLKNKSSQHQNQNLYDDEASNSGGLTGLPRPPKRRNSQVGLNGNPHHRPTATFFKRAAGDNNDENELNADNAKNGKELQFVSQKLTHDVANKTEAIENLEATNTALMEQMQKMQKEMNSLKQHQTNDDKHANTNSNDNITDLP
mmetsp:Transcript_47423/g.76072  ORF Transcript_47423/g.76072 Transcript_47423/m.76072 type:complete len:722 (+) Transcript_47423:64-2229(+)|eukprot:CAMPEP_0197053496 /NCGR_PEP_ID=MMETSP1384-20130603/27753_1 /TAXON_ID=29189 /ORGANISM="Ammonia sp." /LENGTH=721 /DNA_ID=CAMNT_0042486407 /DNA_START=33 /DNA_END=2198 /DNA_ORIENTATION=+